MFFNLRRFHPQKHRRMKKFILHCNRCTMVTRFVSLDFVDRKEKEERIKTLEDCLINMSKRVDSPSG